MSDEAKPARTPAPATDTADDPTSVPMAAVVVKETGGPKGLEPTRYGDWERNGRCFDF